MILFIIVCLLLLLSSLFGFIISCIFSGLLFLGAASSYVDESGNLSN